MNVNLTIREVKELRWVLDRIKDQHEMVQGDEPLLDGIEAKLSEIINVSRWEGINTLIPLGVKVLVKPDKGKSYFATRNEMATSYAPQWQNVVTEDGITVTLTNGLDYWTRHFD